MPEKSLVHGLDISGLLHLTLRQCNHMEQFLRAITDIGQTLNILSLVYNCGAQDDIDVFENNIDVYTTLESFFNLTPTLTDLFLLISGSTNTLEFWRNIRDRKMPLTRFVYHQRGDSRYGEAGDTFDLSLLPEEMDELERAGEHHPYAQMNLMSLRLGGNPSKIVCLTQMSTFFSLKLLTFRLEKDLEVTERFEVTKATTR
jgi:hypothetical protein